MTKPLLNRRDIAFHRYEVVDAELLTARLAVRRQRLPCLLRLWRGAMPAANMPGSHIKGRQ